MSHKVVIVEDDKWLGEQYKRVLKREGFDVYYAPHAVAAIDLIDDVSPDVIILDVLLAGTTALALLHELKSHSDLAAIPIILVSNLADELRMEDVASYGVKTILDKATMQPDDIVTATRRVLV